MVRRIVFKDGIRWVARLALPSLKEAFSGREALDRAISLEVEIASIKFFKYVIMILRLSYADHVSPREGLKPLFLFKLSTFKFDQIGSLYQDETTLNFFISPDFETGKGPWTDSMDYYADLAKHALQVCVADAAFDVQTSFSFAIPILFQHLISLYGQSSSRTGPFSLTNRDLGAHNLLVNDDFEIIGVIDFDGVMAAPIEVVAQYPPLSGLEREPPGYVETRPLAIDRIKRTEPNFKEYKNFVEIAEARMSNSMNGETLIANMMLSNATSVF